MLHINALTYRIGDRLLLDRATVGIPAGHKVGLVGRNGAGKSTLLSLIRGEIAAESGDIFIPPTAHLGHVGQEAPDGPESLLDTVLASHQELVSLNAAAQSETDPHRIAEIHTRLADIGAHSAPARAAAILAGLGFDETAQARPCKSFSGGWRMRVALASVLFNEPDLLLLDEPTNYLDLEGVLWLEQFLRSYPHTVIVVSHDRDLLNRAVGGILHLHDGKLTYTTGGYDDFEAARREKMERMLAMKSKQEAQRRHIEAFVERFRYKASKARQAQSRLKMLERMQPIVSVVEDQTIPFTFPKPEPLSPPLIALERAAVGYEPDRPVLRGLDLRIDMDDRIGLLGANGNGKSTLAKLLSQRLKAMDGQMRKPRSLKVGYFAQHQLDELNPKGTAFDHLARLMPDATEAKVRARLGGFGFGADKADRPVESLSGGEKARLLFALMAFEAPQLIILDEPTNHLDIDSREALIQALNEYDGAVILISHDRHLIDACVDRLLIVRDGTLTRFDGDLEDYRRLLLAERGATGKAREAREDSRKIQRRDSAEARAKQQPLRDRVAKCEAALEQTQAALARAQKALGNPKLYDGSDPKAVQKQEILNKEISRLEGEIEKLEEEWLNAQDAVEAAG